MNRDESVWITGVGAATPLGCELAEIESSLLAGRSGVSLVTRFPTDDYPSRIAAQLGEISPPPGCDPRAFSARPRLEQLAHWCAEKALRDAGLWGRHLESRVGLVLGLGAEWMLLWEDDHLAGGTRLYDPEQDRESTIERVRRGLDLTGPALALSAACASGNHALEMGRHWLRLGLVDYCVAGACDLAVSPIGLATFGNLRALSRRNSDPSAASRPFRPRPRRLRSGRRRRRVRAGAIGRRPSPLGARLCRGRRLRLEQRRPPPRDPQPRPGARPPPPCVKPWPTPGSIATRSITSTPTRPARRSATPPRPPSCGVVLGENADRIPVSSTKSLTGHMLTAAGAFEALACLTALRHQAIPPTINLDDPDVDLCLVANEARPHRVRVAVSNSFGFGGSNTSLVLRAV